MSIRNNLLRMKSGQRWFFKHCFLVVSFFWFFLAFALFSPTVYANFDQELLKLEELILAGGRGDFHEKGLVGVDVKEVEYFRKKYSVFVRKVQAKNSFSQMQKTYLKSIALRELMMMEVLLQDKNTNLDSFCQKFTPVYKVWKQNFDGWVKENKNKEIILNSNWYSDVYRLNADMRISYGRCKSGLSWAVLMTGSVKYYEKAIEINPKNMRAHFSLGTYYFNAPVIGGGDLEKAIEHFKIVIVNGTNQERVPAHVFLAYVEMRNGNQAKALVELEKARKIAPNAPFLLVAQSLVEQGKYLSQ